MQGVVALDWQSAFNILLMVFMAAAGALWAGINKRMDKQDATLELLASTINLIEKNMPMGYTRRDDFQQSIDRIERSIELMIDKQDTMFEKITDKLDRKVDKA